jgi:hypothetical protein
MSYYRIIVLKIMLNVTTSQYSEPCIFVNVELMDLRP